MGKIGARPKKNFLVCFQGGQILKKSKKSEGTKKIKHYRVIAYFKGLGE